MAADSTATSPRRSGQTAGVYRLVALHPPTAARAGCSKVLEAELLLTREAAPSAKPPERLVLDDPEVSRRHALIARAQDEDGFELIDQGSHNGSYVNAVRVERARLRAGDVVRVGQHLLLLQYLDLAASQRLARRRLPGSPLVGDGPASKWIDEQTAACAERDVPVLVLGESGTGKELVARHLHALGGRSGPLVAVNCSALAESLADSELFGHERGAFSGANRARDGVFVEARGGTLLLDELGDMPLALQAKLLRTLETGEVRKVGGSGTIRVDTRVIAATNVDLEAAVSAGRFRGDLWARLQRSVIRLPALRERREDVLLLARHLLQAAKLRLSIGADAAEALLVHDWPYNVRELRNVIETAAQRARAGRAIELEHLPRELGAPLASRAGDADGPALGRAPRDAGELRAILERHGWNISRAAAELGRDRKQIYRWCESFGLDLERRR